MATNNRIKVSDLDFDQIRENLKTYLSGQDQFSDYNYEGSALSTLVDLLAYNTHYNALYTNLAVNEMFLDSASKRSSVVSIANNFGYTPSSAVCSKATLDINVVNSPSQGQTLTLPKWSPFSTSIDSTPYVFYTIEDYTAQLISGVYTFENVRVYEGTPRTMTFVCTEENQKFQLPYDNIDLSTLYVTIQPTGENPDFVRYQRSTEVLTLTATSNVYFIKELEDGTYELSFGTNNLGKPIATGNVITVTGLLTNRSNGDGAIAFSYTGTGIGGTVSVVVTASSTGGGDKESVDQIKYNVSQSFFDQNRAVTPSDYISLVKRGFPGIDAVNVWGGEDNDPPVYGKVFVCVKPTDRSYLTDTEESYIAEKIIKPKSIVSITPEFVRPTYVDLDMNITAYYDKTKTTRSAGDLKAAIVAGVENYRDSQLNSFDGVFRMSRFSTMVDNIDTSITSSITTFLAYVEMEPKYNLYSQYKFNFVNPIYSEHVPEESIVSTGFYIDYSQTVYYLDDDGVGNIRLFKKVEGTGEKAIVNAKIGSVDYATGYINIQNLRIVGLYEPNFYLIIKTQSYDVVSIRNQIVNIPSTRINVNLVEDAIASGTRLGGTNYTFTSSRN